MTYAYVFVHQLHLDHGKRNRRAILQLLQAWATLYHVRRIVMVDGFPALRFDRLEPAQFDWRHRRR